MADQLGAPAAAADHALPDSTSGDGLSGELSEIMDAAEGTPSGTMSLDVPLTSLESCSRPSAAFDAASNFPLPLGDDAPATSAAPSRSIPQEGFPMPTPLAVPRALGVSTQPLTPPKAVNAASIENDPRSRTPQRPLALPKEVRGIPPVPPFDSPPASSLRGAIAAGSIPKSVQVFPMTPRSEPQAVALRDLSDLDVRLREWVSQQFQSRDFHTAQMFNRAQEAGKQLEAKVEDAKMFLSQAFHRSAEAAQSLTSLNADSEKLRCELGEEIQKVSEYLRVQLEQGGHALLLADVELRRDVSVLAERVETANARLGDLETECRSRMANLEIERGHNATSMQQLYDAVDHKLSAVEGGIQSRLDSNERNSGVQELFVRLEEITRSADQRFQELSDHVLTLGPSAPAQGGASSDNVLTNVVTALQGEVDDLRTEVLRARSSAEAAQTSSASKADSPGWQEVHDRVTGVFNDTQETNKNLDNLANQVRSGKSLSEQMSRDMGALTARVRALEASGSRRRTPSDPARQGPCAANAPRPPVPFAPAAGDSPHVYRTFDYPRKLARFGCEHAYGTCSESC